MNKTRKKKVMVLSLGLMAAMLSSPPAQAQGILGDLLDDYYAEQDKNKVAARRLAITSTSRILAPRR